MKKYLAAMCLIVGIGVVIPAATLAAPLQVVTIGDSFSSGDGADNKPGFVPNPNAYYEPDSQDSCRRSSQAAGSRLAYELQADFTFVACSGAKVDNVLNTGQHGEPAQVSAVTPAADYVTLTIGGNDIGFSSLVQRGLTGTLNSTSPETITAQNALNTTLPTSLDALLANLKNRIGSNTKVLVAGYPYIPPKTGAIGPLCSAYLTSAERDLVIQLEDKLNNAVRGAVSRTNDSRFTFVDPTAATSPFMKKDAVLSLSLNGYAATYGSWGRDACNLSPYNGFNTIRIGLGGSNNISTAGSFHPNINGQYYYLQQLRPYAGL